MTIHKKIQALLDKAQSSPEEGERDLYQKKAAELLAKYSIDRMTLRGIENDTEISMVRVSVKELWGKRAYGKARWFGLAAIAGAHGVATTGAFKPQARNPESINFAGIREDIDHVIALFKQLQDDADALSLIDPPAIADALSSEAGANMAAVKKYRKQWRNSFLVGYFEKVATRINGIIGEKDANENTTMAITIQQDIAKYRAALHKGNAVKPISLRCQEQGIAAGSAGGGHADIGMAKVSGARGNLLHA